MMDSVVNVDWTGKMMVYSSSEYLPVRSLAHKVKEGNPEGISKAAGILAGIIKEIPDYQDKVLVPMPGHDGTAKYTKELCDEISSLSGLEVSDVLEGKVHESLYNKKVREGLGSLKPFEFVLRGRIPEGKSPLLVDNVLDTGTTAMSAFRALGKDTALVVLGSTVNHKLYNYPIEVLMPGSGKEEDISSLQRKLKTLIDDALFVSGKGPYDRGKRDVPGLAREKTLSGILNNPVAISNGRVVSRIGFFNTSMLGIPRPVLFTNFGVVYTDDLNNAKDIRAVSDEIRNTYFNIHGNVLSTIGRHFFQEGEIFQYDDKTYTVKEVGEFRSLTKPFGSMGIRAQDKEGNTKTFILSQNRSHQIYVVPPSERMRRGMFALFGRDVSGDIEEALSKALGMPSHNTETYGDFKTQFDMEKDKQLNDSTVKEQQLKYEESQEKEAQKKESQKKGTDEKDTDPVQKIAGEAAQVAILAAAFDAAKKNNGVWLNPSLRKDAGIFGQDVNLTAFNRMLMNAHADINGFKTAQYMSFSQAKDNGISVKGGEQGVPLSWTRWAYENQYDKRLLTHDEYLREPKEEQPNYKAVAQKEFRFVFNIDQTLMPYKQAEDYKKAVEAFGSAKTEVKDDVSSQNKTLEVYNDLKEKHPDALLLFRTGDFYTTYNDDARTAADKLGITLTKPSKKEGIDFLSSFPHHALDVYLPKLIRAGVRVAIVDDPKYLNVKTTLTNDSKQEKEASERMKGLVEQLSKTLVPIKLTSSLERTKYDKDSDRVMVAPRASYETYTEYAHDLLTAVVASTGTENRMNREARSGLAPEDAAKYELLVQEMVAGSVLTSMGLKAGISKDNRDNLDYWSRELREDSGSLHRIERDFNMTVQTIDQLSKGEKVDYAAMRGESAKKVEMPLNYSISREIAKLPSIERKEFVVVRDAANKSADVILPAGASDNIKNEIPGMNKSRIATALKKEGIDGDKISFYNAGGAFGQYEPNSYYDGKDVTVNRIKQYSLVPMTNVDVSAAVQQKAEIERFSLFADEHNNYAIFLKPANEKAITMYPSKDDIGKFFSSLKSENGKSERDAMAQKYYFLAKEHPEYKKDLLSIGVGETDLSRIGRVNIFKSGKTGAILLSASIDGERQPPREVSKSDWNRFWLVDDKEQYKTQLAAKLFDNVLNVKQEQKAEQEVQQDRGFHR